VFKYYGLPKRSFVLWKEPSQFIMDGRLVFDEYLGKGQVMLLRKQKNMARREGREIGD